MNSHTTWVRLLAPLLIMSLLAGAVMLEQQGAGGRPWETQMELLPPRQGPAAERTTDGDYLLVYHGDNAHETQAMQTVADTLQAMRIGYTVTDLANEPFPEYEQVSALLLIAKSLAPIAVDAEKLIAWVESGGKLGIMMAPETDAAFQLLHRKLGISDYAIEMEIYNGLRYTTGMLPVWQDTVFSADLVDYALTVRLEPDCVVHIESTDSRRAPLLWERPLGKGRVAVLNNFLLSDKDSRGLAAAVLFSLEDTVVYPIIHAGMFFVDDFPAPQPEGYDQLLLKDYGYDIQGVFRNRWWPDMKALAQTFGLRYTGVLIETYNDIVNPPYVPEATHNSLIKYFASELLHAGGEMGLHGYNHMPLALPGFVYAYEPYIAWPTIEAMQGGIEELLRYGGEVMPEYEFTSYVPPSNYLTIQGREALLRMVPTLRVFSGLYLGEDGVNAYVQEFQEEEDGTISVPRVSSGFVNDNYSNFILAQELLLHGVVSHFIHPDDILDESRGASLGWEEMKRDFTRLVDSITRTYPQLRMSTATEGAGAIQRYDRLSITREETAQSTRITLEDFYDTAWLAVRTRGTIASVEGGQLFDIAEGFHWIRADEAELTIHWEDRP